MPKSLRHASRKRPTARAAPVAARRHIRVDKALHEYLQNLARATSGDTIAAALAQLGAHFRMPHLELAISRLEGNVRRGKSTYRSPDAPKHILKALHRRPLIAWSLAAEAPVSLSQMKERLAEQGLPFSRELEQVEALTFSLPTVMDRRAHATFFGTHGVVDGLTRSILFLGFNVALERTMHPVAPSTVASKLTPRELQVLDLAKSGRTDAQVAKTLGMTTRTVRFHLTNAKRKTQSASRSKLIAQSAWR